MIGNAVESVAGLVENILDPLPDFPGSSDDDDEPEDTEEPE